MNDRLFWRIIQTVMPMLSLRHPYIRVAAQGGPSYGGSQQFSENHMMSLCGCGVIAATDTLLYLGRYHLRGTIPFFAELTSYTLFPFPSYTALIHRMRRAYFPLIPYAGINGLMLALGIQRFFRDNKMPFSARWCMSRSEMWPRVRKMLAEDIPVIMSVGPNFPLFWQNKRACFYHRSPEGAFVPAANVKAHYFTVTGMNDEWLRISSWGRMYYLNRREFEDYVREHSAGFISNILYIEYKL